MLTAELASFFPMGTHFYLKELLTNYGYVDLDVY